MSQIIADEKLDQMMKEGLEAPPEGLLERVQAIPERYNYSLLLNHNQRSDTLLGLVTGIIGLWILGIFILYKDLFISFFIDISSMDFLGTSFSLLLPFSAIIAFVFLFANYLFPADRVCGSEPC